MRTANLTLLLTSCLATTPVHGDVPESEPSHLTAYAWDCEDQHVVTQNETTEKLWLFLSDRTLELPLVPSGSGIKYAKDGVIFWTKGVDQALLVDGGQVWRCGVDRRASIWEDAKLRGLDFRAVGNEPGWVLELGPDRIRFEYDYGTRHVEVPRPGSRSDAATRRTVFATEAERLPFELVLEAGPCTDTMSDETFETRVELHWGDRHYVGCGRALH